MDGQFWDVQMETLPAERRRLLREHRLHWQVRRCWEGSPFYRDRFERSGLDPALAGGLPEWERLPILRVSDLPTPRTPAPLASTWAVAPESWWERRDELTGYPPRVVTDGDGIHRADLAARALWAAGARTGQPLSLRGAQHDLAASGPVCNAIVTAAERVGMPVVQGTSLSDPIGTVPFVAVIAASSADGEPPEADNQRTALVWGDRFESGWRGNRVVLGLPFVGPTLAYGCPEGDGLHWNDDHFLIEIVESDTGPAVRTGSPGRLVITDLAREGSPLLRFWTGLETVMLEEACPCGRTSARSPSVRPLT